jgi:L-iditol 2-dehydrogenase
MATYPATMTAVRLYGARDMRIEQIPHPGLPGPEQVLIKVTSTSICGSDLHSYKDGRIGDNVMESPLILGHEFAAVVEAVGDNALGGDFMPLRPGMRVAVDPAQPCWACEMCEEGNPNFCYNMQFCGAYPDDGSLCQWMLMPARSCFPIPDSIDDPTAALLEPLGIAIHAMRLAKIEVGDSVAILGAGPIGLTILELVKLAGARPIFVSDKFDWRLGLTEAPGVMPINVDKVADPIKAVVDATGGRGVDVAIEAAWADESVQQAAAMARYGGRLVIVGISEHDELLFNHSTVRRKGLTIRVCRRMKHTYPRAIKLVEQGMVNLSKMISHRVPLEKVPEAFAMNLAYEDNVVKIMVEYPE